MLLNPPSPQLQDIIQPVLQYPGDFGRYWSVKSWYVTVDAGAVESREKRVDVGSYIFGVFVVVVCVCVCVLHEFVCFGLLVVPC